MEHDHDVRPEPISIARCRELLGSEADDLSDVEVDQMRRHAEVMAHVVVEIFLEQRGRQE
jgi:hypothetical protein